MGARAGHGRRPLLAIVGHIDEIALVVTHAGDDGMLAVRPLGGFDPHVLLGQRLEILTRDGPLPAWSARGRQKRKRGEDRKPLELRRSLSRRRRDATGTRHGRSCAPATLRSSRARRSSCATAASPRARSTIGSAAYVALEVARRIAEEGGAPGDVAGLAVVQEEVGDFAGARTAAFELEPAVAIAVDVTHATDVRGGDRRTRATTGSAAAPRSCAARSMHPQIFELLYETAEAEGIPFTVEVSRGHTNTDADAVYLSRVGVATGLVSVPLRYMHTPVEIVDLDDVEAVVRLLVAFAAAARAGRARSPADG